MCIRDRHGGVAICKKVGHLPHGVAYIRRGVYRDMSRLRFAWRSLAKAPLLSLVDSDRRVGDGSSGGTAVGAIYRDAVVRREGARRDSGGRRGAGVDGDGGCGGVPAGAPPKIARGLVGHATTDSKTVSWQSLPHQKLFTPATPLFIKYLQAIDNLRTPFSHTRCAILNTVEEVRRRNRLRHHRGGAGAFACQFRKRRR